MNNTLVISVRQHEGWQYGVSSFQSPAPGLLALIVGRGLPGPVAGETTIANYGDNRRERMNRRITASRQNSRPQTFELRESPIECHHFQVSGNCKGSQVSVTPNVGRKTLALRETAPRRLDISWLSNEHDAVIGQHQVEPAPCIDHGNCMIPKHFWIRGQTQKTHLGNTADATAILVSDRVHPSFRRSVVNVRWEGER